jgi:Cft2 family RNA processing exonuclease
MMTRFYLFTMVAVFAMVTAGCGLFNTAISNVSGIVGLNETATVIVRRANLRSSYAVVAADLLEVQRGAVLDVLEDIEFEKVHWFRVRSRDDEDLTEGWIEAQNIITGTLLEKSKKLAEESKDLQPQAKAQLKAVSNLRLSSEVSKDNVLVRLENGASFDIIGLKYVVKPEEPVTEDAANQKPKTKNEEIEAAKEADKPAELDEKYDIWYRVRLAPSQSPVPEGSSSE